MNQYAQVLEGNALLPRIRQLFSGDFTGEVMTEILQNSVRAGATTVSVEVTENAHGEGSHLFILDNGHGIEPTLDGWFPLFRLGLSVYQDPLVEEQAPAGMGLMSLLAHREVAEITFRSNDRRLTVDTAAFWGLKATSPSGYAYWQKWSDLLMEEEPILAGYCQAASNNDTYFGVEIILPRVPASKLKAAMAQSATGNWAGFGKKLALTLNGASLTLGYHHKVERVLIDTLYAGNQLQIGVRLGFEPSTVCWYGQPVRAYIDGFSFDYQVWAGTPLDMQYPTRQGLVKNEKYYRLLAFVVESLDKFFADAYNASQHLAVYRRYMQDRLSLDPAVVSLVTTSAPNHVLAAEFLSEVAPGEGRHRGIVEDTVVLSPLVAAQAAFFLSSQCSGVVIDTSLLTSEIQERVARDRYGFETGDTYEGLSSFLPVLSQLMVGTGRRLYALVGQAREGLELCQLMWRPEMLPETKAEDEILHLGVGSIALCRLSPNSDQEQAVTPWLSLADTSVSSVLLCMEPGWTDLGQVNNPIVGRASGPPALMQALRQKGLFWFEPIPDIEDLPDGGFDPWDFEASLEYYLTNYFPLTAGREENGQRLKRFFEDKASPVVRQEYIFAAPEDNLPAGVKMTNRTGETIYLEFLSEA